MGGTSRVTGWTIAGTVVISLSIGCLIFAHAFPYWQESEKSRDTGVPNIGLWNICFRKEGIPAPGWITDTLGKRFNRCYYMFERDLRTVRSKWIFKDWFIAVIFFATLGLILQPLAIIFNVLYYVRVCSPHLEYFLMAVSSLLNLINGFTVAIAIFVFGIMASRDRYWMPQPESNHLSYSWGVAAVVPVLSFIASMCHTVDFLRLKSYRDRNARAKIYARGEFARY
ncbi:pmp-22/emp/mp20/claudin tight junction [Plakobranchus ocellatus]|uniref:Pmp-22/emp/mp20/claudin tight junction n=1 Tax=Plakobranchus ocellatus TaxID=259542 RepID=A0AAV4BCB2_9GAST|nr:pmp-22/emp/mp20/claudin tight junction [Plakobranchus ocellatus]